MTFMAVLVAFLAPLGLTIKITNRKEEALLVHFSSMASKPIIIHWIRTGFQLNKNSCLAPYYKQFSKLIGLIPISFGRAFGPTVLTKLVLILHFLFLFPRKAVYNTIYSRTNILQQNKQILCNFNNPNLQ